MDLVRERERDDVRYEVPAGNVLSFQSKDNTEDHNSVSNLVTRK